MLRNGRSSFFLPRIRRKASHLRKEFAGILRYKGTRRAKTSRCFIAIVCALRFRIRGFNGRNPIVYQLVLAAVAHSAQVGKLLYHLGLLALYIGQ